MSNIVLLMPTLDEREGLIKVLKDIEEEELDVIPIIVDGLSTDGTRAIVSKNGLEIVQETRKGYGYAMETGLDYVVKNYPDETIIVTMDADGSYDVKDVPELTRPILEDRADFVSGNRQFKNMTLKTKFGNKLISRIADLCLGLNIRDTQSGMKALRVKLMKVLEINTDGISWQAEFITQAKRNGARMLEVPISYSIRMGSKKLGRIKDGVHEVYSIARMVVTK